MKAARLSRVGVVAVAVTAFCCVANGTRPASGQPLYSFESTSPPLDGWTAANATLSPSTTFGVTDGTKSMLIDDLSAGFKNDVGLITTNSGTPFDAWTNAAQAIAAGRTSVKLEFDFSWDHTNVTGAAAFAQLGMFVNSTGVGFKQYGTGGLLGGNVGTGATDLFPRLDPAAVSDGVILTNLGPGTIRLAIPLGPTKSLNVGTGSFYQMGFKSNGGWVGTVDWAIDNVKITGAIVPTSSETLFSWETPDNPATTEIDERYEGWTTGFQAGHTHEITTTGATDGTHALQIDRTSLASGFTWGSQFQISSDIDPGPGQTIDPALQAIIDSLTNKIFNADRIAFDVTYQYIDRFPLPDPTPTGTRFAINISDESGEFYQASTGSIDVSPTSPPGPHTSTLQIPLSAFNSPGGKNLLIDGFVQDNNYLRIALATNTNGAQIYQIDNFRLLTEILEGDFNGDGNVNAADYVLWRHDPAAFGGNDGYNTWRANFNATGPGSGSAWGGSSAVPEPTSIVLLLLAIGWSQLTFRW